jgi:hypothetical protein
LITFWGGDYYNGRNAMNYLIKAGKLISKITRRKRRLSTNEIRNIAIKIINEACEGNRFVEEQIAKGATLVSPEFNARHYELRYCAGFYAGGALYLENLLAVTKGHSAREIKRQARAIIIDANEYRYAVNEQIKRIMISASSSDFDINLYGLKYRSGVYAGGKIYTEKLLEAISNYEKKEEGGEDD